MPDREKVIREIEDALSDDILKAGYIYGLSLGGLKNNALTDALSLLKEYPEIVQCKDCKYGVKSPTFQYYPEVTWCNKHSTSHNDEWFCADGERKEGR